MISPVVFYADELRKARPKRLLELAVAHLRSANGEDCSDSEKIKFARICIEKVLAAKGKKT